jgi:hypothetical protein
MPASNIWTLEYANSNANRRYPLADTATATDVDSLLTLPDSFLTSLRFPIPADLEREPSKIHLLSVTVFGGGYSVELGYDGTAEVIATATISTEDHTPYQPYLLVGEGDFEDCTGMVAFGSLDEMDSLELVAGKYLFSIAGGRLDPSCVDQMPRGLRAITIVEADGTTHRLQGEVELLAGTNMDLAVVRVDEVDTVQVNAIAGAGLTGLSTTLGLSRSDYDEPSAIRTINGVPFANGAATFSTDTCITITAGDASLTFSNPCSQECCECEEAQNLIALVNQQRDELDSNSQALFQLQAEFQRTVSVITNSRINSSPCLTCD